ncbi:hypothetical protein CO669_20930 [Bradyrhizobium sp. Y36]|nr:hypothetical protein CO669_20930 [Bradyrhizobium sp. Y36]
MLPFAASAQAEREEASVSRLRACVRAHAADAQAVGVRTPGEAESYFIDKCVPLFGMFLNPNRIPTEEVGPLAPGIYRKAIEQEWRAFLEGANGQR